MSAARTTLLAATFLGLATLAGCGGSGSSGGRVNVHLVDGPVSGFQEINVHVLSVEIAADGGWTTLGRPDRTLDLLRLTGGVEETLVSGASLPAGHYGQMRLVLGSGNTVKLAEGSVEELKVPSGLQTGVKLPLSFDVRTGTTEDIYIDFDAARSIQVVGAGASGQYLLRPTVRAFDRVVTGSIAGTLMSAGIVPQPLAGAVVCAETLDGSGNASLARSAVTDANGRYTLDLLPVGATYYIVSQPLVGTTTYVAKASGPLAISASSPVLNHSAFFTPGVQAGSVSGTVSPLPSASQSDSVELLQVLDTGSGAFTFILRSTMAAVDASTETYAFATVPSGAYTLRAVRTTLAPDGSSSSVASAPVAAAVAAGPVTADLGF